MFSDGPRSEEKSQPLSQVRYSIIITCYNQREFIRDTVESVLSQGHASKEVIVVDDGSRDGSLAVLKQYRESVELLALSTNLGASGARNRGAAIARGEYLIFLDGDDLFTPWALNIYERLIEERRPTAIVSGARRFEGSLPVLRGDEVPRRLEFVEYESLIAKDRSDGLNIGAFVIHRRAFNDAGGWSPGIWYLDGQDLYAKLAYSGSAILVLSPYTMFYRMHAANSIRSVPPYVQAAHLMIDRERAGQYPGGRLKRFERYARHGGVILFCTKKILRAGLYRDALRLAVRAWTMILAAVILKSIARLKGQRPVQTYELRLQKSICHDTVAQHAG